MIYLDYQATTPLAPEARRAMLPWLGDDGFANPHSAHAMGRAAKAAVEVAREQVAALFPSGGKVIFTGSATEALNLAIQGRAYGGIAVSAIEHAAVRATARTVGGDHELAGVAERAHQVGALFLCDAVQGASKLAAPAGADLIAVSAHKLYGPKGIGALWVRDGVELSPLIHGGGQEGGLRSGTLSPALCAAFGAAAQVALARQEVDAAHASELWDTARNELSRWTLNGSEAKRWKGNLNLYLNDLDVARLMSECRRVMFSAGSACASGSGRPSHVLRALGLSDSEARSSIRLGFGRYTTRDELIEACRAIEAGAKAQGV